jgi:hypothetical protein
MMVLVSVLGSWLGWTVRRTRVQHLALAHLKNLSHLTTLSLVRTRVSDAGVRNLQRALPRLYVVR